MKQKPEKQVFYDPTRHRWNFSRFSILAISLVLSASFGLVVFKTLGQSNLPKSNPTSSNLASKERISPYVTQNNTAKKNNPPNQVDNEIKLSATVADTEIQTVALESAEPEQTVYAYLVNWDDASFESLKINIDSIDKLIPEWIHLADIEGDLTIDDSENQNKILSYVKSVKPEMKIIPLINNFNSDTMDWDSQTVSAMLKNPVSRRNNIEKILAYVGQKGLSGVSIDYEALPDESRANFTIFIKELYQVFHPLGLEVSVNLPLDDQDFDFAGISANSDFVMLMAYDQNTPYGGGLPGPIASQDWLSTALKIKTTQLPVDKTILSLGNYGYDWPDNSSSDPTTKDWTFTEIMNLASEKKSEIRMDTTSFNPRFDYQDDNGNLRHIWFLDGATIYNQAKAANSMGVFNFAVWRLGSEDPTTWQIFPNLSKPHKEVGEIISNIDFRNSIRNIGDGEILKVMDVPTVGKRKITIDASKNLVISENYLTYPSPFIVQRWGAADKKLAITFDDGPDANYTSKILDILDKNNIKATFFIIGANASKNQDIIKRIDREGHEIGSHTFTHPNILNISQKQLLLELNLVENMLGSVIKKNTLLFRPPYAEDSEPQTPDHIGPLLELSSLGYYTVAMHLDPLDWSRPGAGEIVNRITKDLDSQTGNILLLHDGGGNRNETVEALPEIIAKAKERGYEFVTVSDLMGLSKDDVMPQIPAGEKLVSSFSWVAFVSSDIFMSFFKSFFFIGIALGLARFGFVGILAIIQKIISARKAKNFLNKNYAPRISVVIPAYNEEKVILRTVRSILDSDYLNLNIIVVDDGSTDNTYRFLLNAFSDNEKVSILTQPNSGKAAALNFGISHCQSEIIVTLDADTLFRKDTISKLVRHFENSRIGAIAGNAKVGNRINILTYWQALEYITNQNLDRRAFSLLNCITVVPGSVGAWRKKAILEAGGFQDRTLAEDSDLTFFIIRNGYKVAYEDSAIAFTEAPDTVRNFIKQRFRWMYGTFQSAWLHKRALLEKKSRFLGIIGIPNIFIFQVIFPLLSPIVDAALVFALLWIGWQKYQHPLDFNAMHSFQRVFVFYALFLIVDFLTSSIAFFLEKKEDWSLLFWIFPQRFFYRQLMYFVAIKVFIGVLRGKLVDWGKFERKASVRLSQSIQSIPIEK